MNSLLANLYWILAQADDKVVAPVKENVENGDDGFNPMMPAFIVIGIIFLMTMFRGPRKEKTKREELLRSLNKNDKVVTHTGIIGTVANISNDLKEITLKVEDSTRIKFVASAIAGRYQDGADDKAKDGK
jgi:preprotein translocase YajC subunit